MLATDPIPDLGPWSKTFLFAYNVTLKETWVAVIFAAAEKKNQQKDCWNGDLLLGCKILQLWLPLSFGSCQDFLHVVNELASQGLVSSQRVLSFDSDMLTRVGNMAASTTTELEAFMERFKHKKYSARLAPRFCHWKALKLTFVDLMFDKTVILLDQLVGPYGDFTAGFKIGAITDHFMINLLCEVLMDVHHLSLDTINETRLLEWGKVVRARDGTTRLWLGCSSWPLAVQCKGKGYAWGFGG